MNPCPVVPGKSSKLVIIRIQQTSQVGTICICNVSQMTLQDILYFTVSLYCLATPMCCILFERNLNIDYNNICVIVYY